MKVYLDADVIVAVYDPSDLLHKSTENISKDIFDRNYETVLGVNILIECLTIVSLRLGVNVAKKLLERILTNCEVIYLDKKLIKRANRFFKKRTSKNVSYSDCISFAIMRSMRIKKVSTFDSDFKKQGFEMLT